MDLQVGRLMAQFMRPRMWLVSAISSYLACFSVSAKSAVISEEYHSAGGASAGYANGGSVAYSGIESLKLNPAMLAIEKRYSLSGSYHFQSFGRHFYKAGVVDSHTSQVAAGLAYTGFAKPSTKSLAGEVPINEHYIDQRLALGLAIPLKYVAAGVTVQWTEAAPVKLGVDPALDAKQSLQGMTWNAGLVGLLAPGTRAGISIEGFGSEEMRPYAPRAMRAGLAMTGISGIGSGHLDYVQTTSADNAGSDEQLLTGSFAIKVYDYFRVHGAYGQDIRASVNRETAAIGLSFVAPRLSLSVSKTASDIRSGWNHDSINMNLDLAM